MTETKKGTQPVEDKEVQTQNEVSVSISDMMNVFEKPGQMKDYTSELVKLEPGEELKGILEKGTETLEGEEGNYQACRIHRITQGIDGELSIDTVLIAGQVMLSAHEKIFTAHPDKSKVPVLIVGRGTVKSKANRSYQSLTVKSI